jgi:hypothetical protein
VILRHIVLVFCIHRCVSALNDVAAQLGPIGAAIQVKLAATEDEQLRALMGEQKALAVDLYGKLQVSGFGRYVKYEC